MSNQNLHQWWADSFGPNASDCRELVESLLYPLNETEIQHIRNLGCLVAEALVIAADSLTIGISKQAMAALIHHKILKEGALPDMVFVAFDERH